MSKSYEIFEKLCKKHGVTPYKVSQDTKVATATLSAWKQNKYTPKQEKLELIADYFGITVDELKSGEKEISNSSEKKPEVYISDVNQLLESAMKSFSYALKENIMNQEKADGKKLYYLDPETAEVAQGLYENKEMKILFDAAKGSRPEDLKMAADFLMRLKKTEEGEE